MLHRLALLGALGLVLSTLWLIGNIVVAATPVARLATPVRIRVQGTPTPTPTACSPAWVVIPSPNGGANANILAGIVARSATDSWAVGFYTLNGDSSTLTTHWDGSAWTQIPSPNPGSASNQLRSVVAPAINDVWAVGNAISTGGQTLILHWTGGPSWAVVPSPTLTNSNLTSITAASATDLWAAGSYTAGTVPQTLIVHGDGTSWTTVPSPNPGSTYNNLTGIAARAANDAWAVGVQADSNGPHTLILHWEGTSWTAVPSPNPGPAGNILNAVTVLAADDAWAVGEYDDANGNHSLTLHWDGLAWSVVGSPSPGTSSNYLNGVSARASSDVWAVGDWSNGGTPQGLILHWEGTQWTLVPNPTLGPGGYFNAVSARTASDVWAVGATDTNTLTEHYAAACLPVTPLPTLSPPPSTRTRTPSPSPTTTPGLTPTVCGPNVPYSTTTSTGATIIPGTLDIGHHCEICDSTIALPFPYTLYDQTYTTAVVGSNGYLNFSAVYPGNLLGCFPLLTGTNIVLPYGNLDLITNCAGCGIYTSISGQDPTRIFNIEWRTGFFLGAHPTTPTTPLALIFEVRLYEDQRRFDVIYGPGVVGRPLVGVQRDPGFYSDYGCNNPALSSGLQIAFTLPACGVPTLSPTPTAAPTHTVTPTPTITPTPCGLRWQGMNSPNPGAGGIQLNSVAVVSATDLWAVGYYDPTPGAQSQSLTLHWDGTNWSVVPSPNPGAFTRLYGVTALAPDNVWAVGTSYDGGPQQTTVIEHWTGSSWTVVPSPNTTTYANILKAVTSLAPNDLWAVGLATAGTTSQTLTVHWDGTAWRIIPSPNPGAYANQLQDISASGPADVWAVGMLSASSNAYTNQGLILHWTGSSWSVVPRADPGQGGDALNGVAAHTRTDVWAVGDYLGRASSAHWDGTAWTLVPVPTAFGSTNLADVVALGANDAWAVGLQTTSVSRIQTFIVHWAGSQWTPVDSPNGGTQWDQWLGLAARSPDDLVAVGTSSTTGTLIARYTGGLCNSGTPTPISTPTATRGPGGPTRTATAVAPPPSPSATVCPLVFTDVPVGSTFYNYVRCLACRGIVGGYPCGGPGEPCPGSYFRPNNNVTRGQVAKIVSESAGFANIIPSTQQTFADVAPSSTFHLWIERLSGRGIIGGYPCGGPFEPCVAPGNRPYFRPNNNVTRGQLAKITSGAAGYTATPTGQTFEDVPPASTFYLYIERLASRGIIGGYSCGGAGEPCLAPLNRPYFRPNNPATRGQMSKIAAAAFFPNCVTPARWSGRPPPVAPIPAQESGRSWVSPFPVGWAGKHRARATPQDQ